MPRIFAIRTSCRGCAPISTSSSRTCRASSGGSRTGCSGACLPSRTGPGSSISRRGMLDPARLHAHRHRPVPAALLQAGEGHQLPRHGGDASPRQLGLDAGAADHGRGDLRRHPGPHARALRRQGRDPRLHDAGPGRAGSRASCGCNRQARQSRPPQRSAPHRLQVRRRAVAAGAQEPRADDARGAAQGEHRRRGARLGAQAPARPARAAPHPDGDLGRRAGRRFDPVGQSGELPRAAPALRDRGHRDALAGRAHRDRHRPRRDALLPARRHDRRRGRARRRR